MAASRILSRSLLTKLTLPPRLRALSALSSVSTTHPPPLALASRFLSTRTASSSLKDPNPNWSNRPPKETIFLDGCDFEHWLVVMEKPEGDPTRDEIIDSYVKTLAMVVGSEEEARMKLYSVSTRHYFAFGCLVSEELSYKIKELPRVRWVLPDSYLYVQTKDYGGEPVINGVPVPYDPKYHEEWVKNHNHAKDRNDRNNNRTRRRDTNIQSQNFPRNAPMSNSSQSSVGGPPQNNMSGPQSHTAPSQNTGGTPLYTGGYQPNNAGGYQPNHAGGYQPNHTGGYQPNNRGGFPPNNAGGMPPNNTGGYQTSNMGSFQQNNMGGMPPNNANQPHRDMGGYQSNNTGVIPQNMGGFQPSNMGAMPPNAANQPNREYSKQGPYMNSSPSNRDFQNGYSQSNRGIPSGGNTHQQCKDAMLRGGLSYSLRAVNN